MPFTPEQIAAISDEAILAIHFGKTRERQSLALRRLALPVSASNPEIISAYRESATWSREKLSKVFSDFPNPVSQNVKNTLDSEHY